MPRAPWSTKIGRSMHGRNRKDGEKVQANSSHITPAKMLCERLYNFDFFVRFENTRTSCTNARRNAGLRADFDFFVLRTQPAVKMLDDMRARANSVCFACVVAVWSAHTCLLLVRVDRAVLCCAVLAVRYDRYLMMLDNMVVIKKRPTKIW